MRIETLIHSLYRPFINSSFLCRLTFTEQFRTFFPPLLSVEINFNLQIVHLVLVLSVWEIWVLFFSSSNSASDGIKINHICESIKNALVFLSKLRKSVFRSGFPKTRDSARRSPLEWTHAERILQHTRVWCNRRVSMVISGKANQRARS